MRKSGRRSVALAVAALAALAGSSAFGARAQAPSALPQAPSLAVKWTRISMNVGAAAGSAGMLRNGSGLHVVWASGGGIGFALHYSTVGTGAKLLNTGTIVHNWPGVSFYPRLVPGPAGGMRLIFNGANGVNGSPYNLDTVYTATSTSAGTAWTLQPGSMSHSKLVPITDDAAATLSNGTPVAAWSVATALDFHVGIDSTHTPAVAPDQSVGIGAGTDLVGPALVRDPVGSIWAAWFNGSGHTNLGYTVARILPTRSPLMKAPGSGGTNLGDNEPFGPVAFAGRAAGGEYLAYCVPTTTQRCVHIALWKAGAAAALTVPGSTSTHAFFPTLAAAPGGHLWILWYEGQLNVIRAVRTNAAVTRFGPVETFAAPPSLLGFDRLQAEGSGGRLDVLALELQTGSGASPAWWDTQILPPLSLSASKSSFSHTTATTITFTVTDGGDAVSGATVSFLGKTAKTNTKGMVTFTIAKGTSVGKHVATAFKGGYTSATFTVKVT